MAGVLYSLVALGFVLIFKASGVFNFAQGAMVLFAALAVARLSERMPLWVAIVLAVAIMIALAMIIERLVLRPLVNQEPVALLMATLGVTYFLDGFGQTVWGRDIYKIELGIPREPVMILDDVFQGGILSTRTTSPPPRRGVLVAPGLLPEDGHRAGVACRGGRPPAAQSIGIPLSRIWVIVCRWLVALAGVIWGPSWACSSPFGWRSRRCRW
jgi:branched-chain amino acid transport system permease protein